MNENSPIQRTSNERDRAMLHDLIVAVLEGRDTREDEPVPRVISVAQWQKALRKAKRSSSAPGEPETAEHRGQFETSTGRRCRPTRSRRQIDGSAGGSPDETTKNWAIWHCMRHGRLFAAHAGCSMCRVDPDPSSSSSEKASGEQQ